MIIRWSNEAKTHVRIEVSGIYYELPTDNSSPDWLRIKAMIEAGTLVIPDYEPPAPPPSQEQ